VDVISAGEGAAVVLLHGELQGDGPGGLRYWKNQLCQDLTHAELGDQVPLIVGKGGLGLKCRAFPASKGPEPDCIGDNLRVGNVDVNGEFASTAFPHLVDGVGRDLDPWLFFLGQGVSKGQSEQKQDEQ
jgi:hypothetical protein